MQIKIKRAGNVLIFLLLLWLPVFGQDSLSLGEFTISKIIDGDTFEFDGLNRSARLLGIDTEEMYKGKNAELKTNALRKSWREVYDSVRGKEGKPIKHNSPFGYETWFWAKDLFKDVEKIRLEREGNGRFIDTYGRYLVYVIAIREDGSEFNYNIECVRQGYSPYFTKYGYSKRFDKEFAKAQTYAQENKSGIWSGKKLCYPDYTERVKWWNRRADAIRNFEKKYKGRDGYYEIMDEKNFHELRKHIGEDVIIFGGISDIFKDKDPYLVRLSYSATEHLDLVINQGNKNLLDELKINELAGEIVYVKGKLQSYNGRVEIELTKKDQMWRE